MFGEVLREVTEMSHTFPSPLSLTLPDPTVPALFLFLNSSVCKGYLCILIFNSNNLWPRQSVPTQMKSQQWKFYLLIASTFVIQHFSFRQSLPVPSIFWNSQGCVTSPLPLGPLLHCWVTVEASARKSPHGTKQWSVT